MSDCVFDDDLTCLYCGWKARVAKTRRTCPKLVGKPGTLPAVATRYATELGRWIAAGSPVRTDSQVDELLATCSSNECGEFADGRCSKCGCPVNKSKFGWMNKLRMATTRCPLPVPRWVESVSGAPRGIRLGLVLPNLLVGGVERWATTLAKTMQAERHGAYVAAVAFVGHATEANEMGATELSRYAPIVGACDAPWCYRVPMPHEAIRAASLGCDVLAVWSVGGLALEALKLHNKPIVGVSHGCGDWWMDAAKDVVTHWVAVSQAAASPVPGDGVVIPNGIDLDRLSPSQSKSETLRAAGIPEGVRVAVSIGRLSREKRLPLAAAALRHLPPDWWLWLVGDGPADERAKIIEAAGNQAGRLVISPARSDVGNVLEAADVALLLSEAEGYGLAPVEALAAGVPLVATPVGILPELGADAAEWLPINPTPVEIASAVASVGSALPRSEREATQAVIDSMYGQPTSVTAMMDRIARYRAIVRRERSADAMAKRWAAFLASVVPMR